MYKSTKCFYTRSNLRHTSTHSVFVCLFLFVLFWGFLAFYVAFWKNIRVLFFFFWLHLICCNSYMVQVNIHVYNSKPQSITVIHHMLESHRCPFGTSEAPRAFNWAKLQNPIQGHTKIPLSIQSSIQWRLHLVSLPSASDVLALNPFNVKRLLCFTPGFLIVTFGQEEDFGRKLNMETIETGGWIEQRVPGLGMW